MMELKQCPVCERVGARPRIEETECPHDALVEVPISP